MKLLQFLLVVMLAVSVSAGTTDKTDTLKVNTYNKPAEESEIGDMVDMTGSGNIFVTGENTYTLDGQVFKVFTVITAAADDAMKKDANAIEGIPLFPSPMIIMGYSQAYNIIKEPDQDLNWINLEIVDPEGKKIGKSPDGTMIQTIFPASYIEHPQSDSVTISSPLEGEYIIIVMAEADAPQDVAYGIGIRIDGSLQVMLADYIPIPKASETDTLDY